MTQSSTTNRLNAGDGSVHPQPLTWSCFGLPDYWLEQRLRPVCERSGGLLVPGEPPASLAALERGEGNWNILFWGDPGEAEASFFEALLTRITTHRPLDCLIAVGAESTLKRQLAMIRAGAFDVLTLSGPAVQIEHAVERAIAVVQARRKCCEKDNLKLINQLAISVNHEINNPLTGLMGTAELLLMEGRELSPKVRRDLQTIIKQCHRIQDVTTRLKALNQLRTIPYGSHDQMLDLGAEEDGPALIGLEPAPVDLFRPAPRILVVDDNPLIIDLIARLFEQRYIIAAANNAQDALGLIEREPAFDLILLDLIMPEMNGLDLFRAIRRIRPVQKALLTTAYEGDPRVEQAIIEGALGCIFKPFQLEELETAIHDALSR